jgi:hypothetical protein
MSGEKCAPVSIDTSRMVEAYDGLMQSAASAARDKYHAIQLRRREERIRREVERLRDTAQSLLTELSGLQEYANRHGDSRSAMQVVDVPSIAHLTSPAALRGAVDVLKDSVSKYKLEVSRVIADQIRKKKQHIDFQSAPTAVVTAQTLLATVESDDAFASAVSNNAAIASYREKMSAMIGELAERHPALEVPPAVAELIHDAAQAGNASAAQRTFDEFAGQLKKLDEEAIAQAKKEKQASEAAHTAEEREMVSALLIATLEDMGYEVSGIEDTCFVEEGRLYARHREHGKHAVRLTITEDSRQVFTEPVRIEEATAEEGRSFDKFWCSDAQMGSFINKLANVGIRTKFRQLFPGKKVVVPEVKKEHQPEIINNREAFFNRHEHLLKERKIN